MLFTCCSSTSSAPASSLPGGGSYTAFAIAGLLALNLTTSSMGTAVGLSTDLNGGVIDRFRTLPMWRPAVLVGRSLADSSRRRCARVIVALTGLASAGARSGGIAAMLAGFAVFLLFSYAMSWVCACLGILSKGPESAQGVGLVILFPLAFVSNALVPTEHMPAVLRCDRGLEPGQRRDRRRRAALRQPQPVGDDPRLADAAPDRRVAALVDRAHRGVRAARRAPLPPPHDRLSPA